MEPIQPGALLVLTQWALLRLLQHCDAREQQLFRRMYSPQALDRSLADVVVSIDPAKIAWAFKQAENTLKKKGVDVTALIMGSIE